MQEYSDQDPEWFSLHMLQSYNTALDYFKEIQHWLLSHESEIVVIWVSKHGSQCAVGNDQFPNVTVTDKQQFWSDIMGVFGELLCDFSTTKINETSIKTNKSNVAEHGERVAVCLKQYNIGTLRVDRP